MVRKRENGDERIKPIKKGLLDSSEAHRGTRKPNKKHRRGTRQTSRRVDSRIPSRSAKHLSGLSPRTIHHHHLLVPVKTHESGGLGAALIIFSGS
ncbi:hypothetical protein E3N88_34659 [Mikania micrantha]|uniref:Uncharacterized protein n=1 Tax=Mikania micrantha TaxID=192012 RepID=A0A5N6LYR9_9ASTR|nr:hypothetical protein E3N88_34659 [Mikania micrantha]